MHLHHRPSTGLFRCLLPLAVSVALASPALAQLDRVYPVSGNAISGTVTGTSRNAVTIKTGSSTQEIPADQVRKILFDGDPAPLTNGREFVLEGQYDQALAMLKTVDESALKRSVAEADLIFYRIFSQGQLALAGKGDIKASATAALAFAGKYQDSWHFYEAAKLLGNLALALDNYDSAIKYYASLRSAPSVETKIESVYLIGLASLQKEDYATAISEFDKVAGVSVQSVEAARLQKMAQAGKAVALARSERAPEGLELVKSLIADLNSTDVQLAARIYNAQGACYEAAGDVEGAIMAYLHTHLMFSSQAATHAEALSKLVELWPQIGKPERATEARQELQQRYPGLAS